VAEYTVDLSPRGRADLSAVARDIALRIVKKLRELEDNPYSRGDTVKRLHGSVMALFAEELARLDTILEPAA